MAKKKIVVLVGLVVVLAGLVTLIAMLLPKRGPRNDYRLGSDTMRIGDKFATLLIVERPRGFFINLQKRLNYGIDLVLHDAADPDRVEVLTITERGEEFKLRNQAKLIGFDGRHLWLFGHTLVGLDLSTRKQVGFADLSRANPALARHWVEESKFYSLDVLAPKLRLSVADARKFELDPQTLVAARYEDKPQEQAKDRAEYQRQMNEYDRKSAMPGVGPDKFFWKGDRVSDEEWFGLLSVEEARVLACVVSPQISIIWDQKSRDS